MVIAGRLEPARCGRRSSTRRAISRDRPRRRRRRRCAPTATSLRVDLGPGLDVAVRAAPRVAAAGSARSARRRWCRCSASTGRRGCSSARVSGAFGTRSLDGASGYAEKNWGAVFAEHWWWGQAEFVAFAGGRVHGVAPTAVAVWTPDEVVTLAPPFARTVARAGGGEWRDAGVELARWRVELEGEASDPLLLPVPIPRERRLEVRSRHHLLGRVRRARPARPPAVVPRRVRRWPALEDGASARVAHDEQRDVVLAALARGPARAARGRRPRPAGGRRRSSASRSRSSPTSIARVRSSIRPSV